MPASPDARTVAGTGRLFHATIELGNSDNLQHAFVGMGLVPEAGIYQMKGGLTRNSITARLGLQATREDRVTIVLGDHQPPLPAARRLRVTLRAARPRLQGWPRCPETSARAPAGPRAVLAP